MAFRQFILPELGEITVYKRRKAKNIRISIDAHSKLRVSIPYWLPYAQGVKFAEQKTEWIKTKRHHVPILVGGDRIGKSHRIEVKYSDVQRVTTRINDTHITVSLPKGAELEDEAVQMIIRKACIRALKRQAEQLLPQRLALLANRYGYTYKTLSIKHLKSRWGSCTSKKEITLNCLLMQLSWSEIDYVIVHELAHTRYMAHSTVFWSDIEQNIPSYKSIKRQLSSHKPVIFAA